MMEIRAGHDDWQVRAQEPQRGEHALGRVKALEQHAMIDPPSQVRQRRSMGRVDRDSKREQGLGVALRLSVDAPLEHVEGDVIFGGEDPKPGIEAPRSGLAVEVREPGSDAEERLPGHGRRGGGSAGRPRQPVWRSYASAAARPAPRGTATPKDRSVISTPASPPRSPSSLRLPRWPMRKTFPLASPRPTPRDIPSVVLAWAM